MNIVYKYNSWNLLDVLCSFTTSSDFPALGWDNSAGNILSSYNYIILEGPPIFMKIVLR